MEQFRFSKEVNRLGAFTCPTNQALNNVLIALLEAPNYEYMDKNSQATNSVALLNKETLETLSVADMKKEELPNCVECFERKISSEQRLSSIVAGQSTSPTGFAIVGTLFMNLEEKYPKNGRILIYEVETQGNQSRRLTLRHIENVRGSVNCMSFVGKDNKYLVVGVNQDVQLWQV